MPSKFSLRIIDADYYIAKPKANIDVSYSKCRQRDVYKVPVIRIFGTTPQGQKACLHVHNIFPYFYVLVPEDEILPVEFGKKFASSLDIAIHLALGKAASNQQEYVYAYEIVHKIPFYGYHHKTKIFLRVYLFNPGLITKVSELLVNASVLNQFFQPFETHIPFLLQFFIDYNLQGMNLINLSNAMFRLPLPMPQGDMNTTFRGLRSPTTSFCTSPSPKVSQTNYDIFNSDTVPSTSILPGDITKQSCCQLECDALGNHILNIEGTKDNNGFNPGLQSIWNDEKQRRRLNNESSFIEMPSSGSRNEYEITIDEKEQIHRLEMVLQERVNTMGEMSSIDLSFSQPDRLGSSANDSITSSNDQSLLDILVDMANVKENEEGEEEINPTPLSETTFINNGLSDKEDEEGNVTEEENEILLMSQTVFGEHVTHVDSEEEKEHEKNANDLQQYQEPNDSWTESFIDDLPQQHVDDNDQPTCSKYNQYIPQFDSNMDYGFSEEKMTNSGNCGTVSSVNKGRISLKAEKRHKHIPQFDGNGDSDSSSADDFKPNVSSFASKSSSKKRGKKKKVKRGQLQFGRNSGAASSGVTGCSAWTVTPLPSCKAENALPGGFGSSSKKDVTTVSSSTTISIPVVKPTKQLQQTKRKSEALLTSFEEAAYRYPKRKRNDNVNYNFEVSKECCIKFVDEHDTLQIVDYSHIFDSDQDDRHAHSTCSQSDRLPMSYYREKYNLKDCKVVLEDIGTMNDISIKSRTPKRTPGKLKMKFRKDTRGDFYIKHSPSVTPPNTTSKVSRIRSESGLPTGAKPSLLFTTNTHESIKEESFTSIIPRDEFEVELQDLTFLTNVANDVDDEFNQFQDVLDRMAFRSPITKRRQSFTSDNNDKEDNESLPDCFAMSPCYSDVSEEYEFAETISEIPESPSEQETEDDCEALPELSTYGTPTKVHPYQTPKRLTNLKVNKALDFASGDDIGNVGNTESEDIFTRHEETSSSTIVFETPLDDGSVNTDVGKDLICNTIAPESIKNLKHVDKGDNTEEMKDSLGSEKIDSNETVLAANDHLRTNEIEEAYVKKTLSYSMDIDNQDMVEKEEPVDDQQESSASSITTSIVDNETKCTVITGLSSSLPDNENDKITTQQHKACSEETLGRNSNDNNAFQTVKLKRTYQERWTEKEKRNISQTNIEFGEDQTIYKDSGERNSPPCFESTDKDDASVETKKTLFSRERYNFLIRFDSDDSSVSKSIKSPGSLDKDVLSPDAFPMQQNEPVDSDHHQRESDLLSPLIFEKSSFLYDNKTSNSGHSYEASSDDRAIDETNKENQEEGQKASVDGDSDPSNKREDDCSSSVGNPILPRFVDSQEYETIKSFQQPRRVDLNDSSVTDSHSGSSTNSSGNSTVKASSLNGSENSPQDITLKSPETSLKDFERFNSGENSTKSFEFTKPKDLMEQMIIVKPKKSPPSRQEVSDSLSQYNLSETQNVDAFFSCDKDLTDKASAFHGQHAVRCNAKTSNLPKCVGVTPSNGAIEHFQMKQIEKLGFWDNSLQGVSNQSRIRSINDFLYGNETITIEPCKQPPTLSKVQAWIDERQKKRKKKKRKIEAKKTDIASSSIPQFVSPFTNRKDSNKTPVAKNKSEVSFSVDRIMNQSDIEGMTPNNTYSFDHTQANLNDAKALHINQHLIVISVEIFCKTRRNLKPDPQIDPIDAIFYSVCRDVTKVTDDASDQSGVFLFDAEHEKGETDVNELFQKTGFVITQQRTFKQEKDMLLEFAAFIRELDPDIIMGYEVQMMSWGYVIERGAVLDLNMCHLLSRIMEKDALPRGASAGGGKPDNWFGQLVNMTITGRIILNVWRVMRSEITLQIYSFENVAYHVLHRRIPFFTHQVLTDWWKKDQSRWRVCQYYLTRCQGNLQLLNSIDFINRTSELARVFGILFYAVISRGSQFRVESMMIRTANPLNYVPVSPTVQQRAKMAAPECIPLVLEPESKFYADPVIVLDFQSLYPSIIIAYNYCYSTCLGKVSSFSANENYRFGATSLNLPLKVLNKLSKDKLTHVSPNGVGFVTANVKRGILPRMLEDILNTRIMVKGAMKKAKEDKVLHRMLDSRQLGLKLIANVTYGYTSANFSGRMPCIEIGDSVVRKARETLERAIHLVNTTAKWDAKVVYGDTDSMFILVKGATKERAFEIGQQIVNEVTAANPKPVKLKFEKVYQPCVLITKKRYVGYSYETLDQNEPIFDAKGIETVRRDNCPAVEKLMEKSIRILFETKDVSLIKSYVQKQLMKILEGKTYLKEFIIAKEYRGMNTYKPGACVPALVLTRKMLKQDRRSEPRTGQRVPYVVIHGSPGLPLIQLVRPPQDLVDNSGLRINDVYYITKQILPALSRIFSLLGVNVNKWYTDLPKMNRIHDRDIDHSTNKKGTISHYFGSQHCPICQQLTTLRICRSCQQQPQMTVVHLTSRIWNTEKRFINLLKICQHCMQCTTQDIQCTSLDCPVFYKLSENKKDMKYTNVLRSLMDELA
ncbi:uncharacterized protein [Clytia hemisphaerica]